MAQVDSSRIIMKGLHIEKAQQSPEFKELISRKFYYDFVSSNASHVNPHLFIVDWQIQDTEENKISQDYLLA